MSVFVEDLDPQQRFEEKERSRQADLEALRSGRKSEAQLKRENEGVRVPSRERPSAAGSRQVAALKGNRLEANV
jgi:hypothetical protein